MFVYVPLASALLAVNPPEGGPEPEPKGYGPYGPQSTCIAFIVRPVTIAMFKTVALAPAARSHPIYPGAVRPKFIVRGFALDELKIPVERVTPSFKVNVPAVNVYVHAATVVFIV